MKDRDPFLPILKLREAFPYSTMILGNSVRTLSFTACISESCRASSAACVEKLSMALKKAWAEPSVRSWDLEETMWFHSNFNA